MSDKMVNEYVDGYMCKTIDVSDYDKVHLDVSRDGHVTLFGYSVDEE